MGASSNTSVFVMNEIRRQQVTSVWDDVMKKDLRLNQILLGYYKAVESCQFSSCVSDRIWV